MTTDTDERIQSAAKLRGYSSPSSFLGAAIQRGLGEREDSIIGAEARIAASLEQVPGGSLSPRASPAGVVRVHARLLKSAGQAMVGDSQFALQDLVNRAEG